MLVFGRPTEQQQRRPKPARFAEQAVVCENVYTDRTPDELRADFAAKAAAAESRFLAELLPEALLRSYTKILL